MCRECKKEDIYEEFFHRNSVCISIVLQCTLKQNFKSNLLYTQLPDVHVHPAIPVRSNTSCASAAFLVNSSCLPSSLAHRQASTASCTSLTLLIPTTTGIRPSAAARTDHATATLAISSSPTTRTASLAASRKAFGAGCQAGGAAGGGAKRPIPKGDAANTCLTFALVPEKCFTNADKVPFWSVRWA